MRIAVLIVTLACSIRTATATTPIVVDREAWQLQLQGIGSQLAAIQAQLADGSDITEGAMAASQLQSVQLQLQELSRLLGSSPKAKSAPLVVPMPSIYMQVPGPGGAMAPATVIIQTPMPTVSATVSASPPAPVAPVAPTPGPVAGAIDEETLNDLIEAISAEGFRDGKLRVLRDAASHERFLVNQIARILPLLTFEDDRVKAVQILAPRLIDRQSGFKLYGQFTFSANKAQVERLLR